MPSRVWKQLKKKCGNMWHKGYVNMVVGLCISDAVPS